MSQENVEVVRRGIEAYNRRDFGGLRAVNDPEIELDYSAPRGVEAGVYRGQEEVFRFYRMFFDAFQRIRLEPERFIDAGDAVVVPNSAQMRGVHGVDTVARSTLVFEIRSGRVIRIRLYQETEEALEAVRLSE